MSRVDPFDLPDAEDARGPSAPVPDELREKHDAMLESMQAPEAKRAMQEAFDADPDDLGRAAVLAAEKASENGT